MSRTSPRARPSGQPIDSGASIRALKKRSSYCVRRWLSLQLRLLSEVPGLSTSALARGGDSGRHRVGGDLGGAGFASGFAVGGADRGYGAYSGRDSAFGGEFHGYGRHDVWGHWGAYY